MSKSLFPSRSPNVAIASPSSAWIFEVGAVLFVDLMSDRTGKKATSSGQLSSKIKRYGPCAS
jgi:hypothetical protein